MAKKRRKHQIEKEEKEYKPPEFDKKGFMETEINVAKGTIFAVLIAIPMGIAAFLIMPLSVTVGLLLGFAGIGVVYFVLTILRVEIGSYKITHWLGVMSSYFFLFLAIWILLCNPPFSDQAGPDIKDIRIMLGNDNNYTHVVSTETGNTITIPTPMVNITVWANITDNVELYVSSVTIVDENDISYIISNDGQEEEYIFKSDTITTQSGTIFTIRARDIHDIENEFSFTLILG